MASSAFWLVAFLVVAFACIVLLTPLFLRRTLVIDSQELSVTSRHTTLRVGETTQVTVRRRAGWFRTVDLEDASATSFWTTGESVLLVEPDGKVTCIGTYGRPSESAVIAANVGRLHGHLRFKLLVEGPGPGLYFVAESAVKEGEQIPFRVIQRVNKKDVTSPRSGTKYTIFVGSGKPNDRKPSIITGGPDDVTAENFIINGDKGTITAPPCLSSRIKHRRVVVLARNADAVGWHFFTVTHGEGSRCAYLSPCPTGN